MSSPQDACSCAQSARERDGCGCERDRTLDVLRRVQRAYEEKLEAVEKTGGTNKMEKTIGLLRSWVGDLVSQNSLLAEAVQQLEAEATSRLLAEKRRHQEMASELRGEVAALRRRLVRKDSDLRGLVEVLRRLREFDNCTLDGIHFFEVTESDIFGTEEWRKRKLGQGDIKKNSIRQSTSQYRSSVFEVNDTPSVRRDRDDNVCELKALNDNLHNENAGKEREIRRLNLEIRQLEQSIIHLRHEINRCECHNPVKILQKDAEVMVESIIDKEEPVKQGASQIELDECREKMTQMEASLKTTGENLLRLRKSNVSLSEETQALRRVCAALDQRCRAAATRALFKDEIIKEMRRQLKQYKAQLKEESSQLSGKFSSEFVSGDHNFARDSSSARESGPSTRSRRHRSKKRDTQPAMDLHLPFDSDGDAISLKLNGSGDDGIS